MDILDIAVAAKRGGGGGTSATIVAPAYSDMTFPISQGERCTKDGKLYEANQTISTSEAWTAAHWDETDVDEQLTELSQGIVLLGTSKVGVSQGVAHAGEFVVVGADGNITTQVVPNANGVSF